MTCAVQGTSKNENPLFFFFVFFRVATFYFAVSVSKGCLPQLIFNQACG